MVSDVDFDASCQLCSAHFDHITNNFKLLPYIKSKLQMDHTEFVFDIAQLWIAESSFMSKMIVDFYLLLEVK